MKLHALILLSIMSLLTAVQAQEQSAEEVHIGRLFMEPNTRQQLDESRKQNSSAQQRPVTEDIEEAAAVTSLRVDGVVMRSDGSTEVWVNGVRSDSQLTVRRVGGNSFQVSVPGGGEITLKPGQIYSFETRRVIEGYEAEKELMKEHPAETDLKKIPTQTPAHASAAPTSNAADKTEFNEAELGNQDFPIKLEQSDGTKK